MKTTTICSLALLCVFKLTWHQDAAQAQGRLTLTLTESGEVTFLAVSPDRRYLASASLDSYVFVWDTSTWKQIASVLPEPPPGAPAGEHQDEFSGIGGLAFSPDNKTVAFASAGSLYTYDISTRVKRVRGRTDAEELTFTPDGMRLIASTTKARVEVWSARTWRKHYEPSPVSDPIENSGAISISPNGQYAAVGGDGGVGIIYLGTMKSALLPLPPTAPPAIISLGCPHQISISADSRFVASGQSILTKKSGTEYSVVVWDISNNTVVFTAKMKSAVWAVAFSLDGSRLFAGEAHDGSIVGWDTRTWNKLCTLGSVGAQQFAIGPKWLATGGGTPEVNIIPLQECHTD